MRAKLKLDRPIWLLCFLLFRGVYANFDCQRKGRFLDPLSDCLRYFFCYEENGKLVHVTFKCPPDQLYSVEETRCLTASNLECKEITGATPIPPDAEIEPTKDFVCTAEGKFVNDFDKYCESYITCTRISGQSYTMSLHYCPTETIFSHITFECVSNNEFQCPKNSENITSSTQSPTSTLEPSTEGNPNESEPPETTPSAPTTIQESSSKDPETTSDRELTETTPSDTTPDSSPSSTETGTSPSTVTTTDASSSSTAAETTTEGEASPSTVTDTDTTNESEPSETTTHIATSPIVTDETTPNFDFTCTEAGRFPNLNDPDCGSYVLCAIYNGDFVSQIQSCSNSKFDPYLGRCSLNYVCPGEVASTPLPGTTLEPDLPTAQSSTTTEEGASTTSNEGSSTVTQPPNFECTRDGRYPNTAEPGCKSYLACKGSGPFTVEIIWCNGTEIYSPNHGRCVRSDEYICPEATTTPTTETSTEFHSSESNEITNPDGSSTTSDLSSTTLIDVSTYAPECMAEAVNQFICPESGRYKDITSTDCKTYILCLRTVIGHLVYAYLDCEDGTIFSDEARMCVSRSTYTCGQ